jgi:hypothetical protein
MATNGEIIEKYDELITDEEGEEAEAIVGGNMRKALDEARAAEREKVLDEAKHFVFKITYDNLSEEEQMQIAFYMVEVVEQYSAFLKKLKKKYEVD